MTATSEPNRCPRCEGCGRIANSEDGEPWSRWLELPLQSSIGILAGIVRPVICPECRGNGRAKPAPESDAAETLARIRALVNEQAEDAGLWFVAQHCSEAYLQAALRRLHDLIEAPKP